MLLRKLFGLSPPPISQFFQFDGRALVSRFGCSLRVYYITLRQYMNLIFPISLFFTPSDFMPSIRLLPYKVRPGVTFSLETAFLLQNVMGLRRLRV